MTRSASLADGPLRTVVKSIVPFLDDPRVVEILLNPDGQLWVERAGEGMSPTGVTIRAPDAEGLLRYVAVDSHRVLNREHPTVAGLLPHWNARVQGWIPPTVRAPTFTIRKPPTRIYSLDDYVASGVLAPADREALIGAVKARRNILVGGGTGSGKTTFVNALLRAIAEYTTDRLYIAEDTGELQCLAPNQITIATSPGRYDLRRAVFDALRARPDRIIVGEVRDGTALELLKAWNTGHPGGVATIHADSAPAMLSRFCQLVEEAVYPAPRDAVAAGINVLVHLERSPSSVAGRRLTGLVRVHGWDAREQRWQLEPLVCPNRKDCNELSRVAE